MRYFTIVMILLTFSASVNGQEAKYKALFMFKFLQNMEWPETKVGDAYRIEVFGSRELVNEMKKVIVDRRVNGKAIEVSEYTRSELDNVNILYIAKSKESSFYELNEQAISKSVVVITESSGLARKGASINFIKDNNRLKFELNEKSFSRAHILVSSEIKTRASSVY
ncbi:MAG: YfiR family protein [Bacteroidota bacterium]